MTNRMPSIIVLLTGCQAMPNLDFNAPPGAPVVQITPTPPNTTDTLRVELITAATDPEGDALTYQYAWLVNGQPHAGDMDLVESSWTAKGQIWEIQVQASDGEWAGEPGQASTTIVNSPPTWVTAEISPLSPLSTDDLQLVLEAEDADDDPITIQIRWSRDGEDVPALDDQQTVPASMLSPHQAWTALVTPIDNEEAGETVDLQVSIDNSPPTMSGIQLSPAAPDTTDTIVASTLGREDLDGDVVSVAWAWSVNGAVVQEDTSDDGQSTLTGAFVKGDTVQVSGTPSDPWVSGDPVESDPLTVVNAPPSIDSVTLDPTSGDESTTFTCTAEGSSDPDGDAVDLGIRWYVDGTAASGSDTLDGDTFDRDQEIYCEITPDDGEDSGEPRQSLAIVIANSAPVIDGLSLSTTAPTEDTSVTATVTGHDDDDDTLSSDFSWLVNGVALSTTGDTLTGTSYDRGDTISVTATLDDGTDSSAPITSATITAANSPPSITSVSVTPTNIVYDSTPIATPSGWADSDGDPSSYTYEWFVDGVSAATTRALDSSAFAKDSQLYCAVSPYDGYDVGAAVSSPTYTVQNSAPTASAAITDGSTATQCDELQLDSSGSTDPDDADVLGCSWALVSAPTDSILGTQDIVDPDDCEPTFVVDAEGTFSFKLTVSDGTAQDFDTVDVSVDARADNTAPVADAGADQSTSDSTVCVLTGYTYVCDACDDATFTIDASGSTDDDGDTLWYRWSTSSSYATIDDDEAQSTALTISGPPATYGTTTTTQVDLTLTVYDCAGGSSEDTVTISYDCEGT